MLRLRIIKGNDYLTTLKKLVHDNNIKIVKNTNGKPSILNSKYYFSVSHSDNKTAIVVSLKPVGIDMEKIRPYDIKLLNYLKIKNKLSDKSFFKEWTRMESYIKKDGLSIADINKLDYKGKFFSVSHQGFMISICY